MFEKLVEGMTPAATLAAPVDGPLGVAVAALTAGVDALLAAGLDSLGRDGLLGLVSAVETQRRRLAAVDHRLIAQVESRAVAAEVGARDTRALLGQVLRLSPAEAGARVAAARDFGPRRGGGRGDQRAARPGDPNPNPNRSDDDS